MHIDFCIEIMKMQMAARRYFIFEHPSSASSWELPRMMRLLKRQGICEVESDQCQYGQMGGIYHSKKEPDTYPTALNFCITYRINATAIQNIAQTGRNIAR